MHHKVKLKLYLEPTFSLHFIPQMHIINGKTRAWRGMNGMKRWNFIQSTDINQITCNCEKKNLDNNYQTILKFRIIWLDQNFSKSSSSELIFQEYVKIMGLEINLMYMFCKSSGIQNCMNFQKSTEIFFFNFK